MSNRKKILITIDWFLPGTRSGGPVRSYANLIDHLNDDFEFYIVTRNTDYGSTEVYENITPNTWVALNTYTKVYYMSADQLSKSRLKAVFESADFDVAYINGIYSYYFSILPIVLLKKFKKPIIISARGMLNPQAFSVKGRRKKLFLNVFKRLGFYNNVCFHATNLDEEVHIKSTIFKNSTVKVAPNLPRKSNPDIQLKVQKQSPTTFVNVGRVSIEKGTLVMLSALEQLNKPLILDLYGPIYDTAYWEACKTVIKKLPNYIKVTYQGVLDSEEVPQVVNNYDFFVLLSEGENFGHAILEALSVGCPVLISNCTPWKNLKAQQLGWDVDIKKESDIIEAWNEAIDMSNSDYLKWSKAAFKYAKTVINNPIVLEQNKALFLNPNNK